MAGFWWPFGLLAESELFMEPLYVTVILEIKITVYICLLNSEGPDSFPKHLDLALAPNKANEGVNKQ